MSDTESALTEMLRRLSIETEMRKAQTRRDRRVLEAFCDYYKKNSSPDRPPQEMINTFLGATG